MPRKNVVIAGGGIAGLLSARAFVDKGHEVTLIEGDKLGGQWRVLNALRYLRFEPWRGEPSLADLARSLGLIFQITPVKGGVLLPLLDKHRRVILPHPQCMKWPVLGEAIRKFHWNKTRGGGELDGRSMNVGDGEKEAFKLQLPPDGFVNALIADVKSSVAVYERVRITAIKNGCVYADLVGAFPFDLLVTTLPATVFRNLCDSVSFPALRVKRLRIYTYKTEMSAFDGYDYVYTPITPSDVVHRVFPDDGWWIVEANDDGDQDFDAKVQRDVEVIFDNDNSRCISTRSTNGHVVTVSGDLRYPSGVVPVGRYAQWDARMTADRAWSRACALARKAYDE